MLPGIVPVEVHRKQTRVNGSLTWSVWNTNTLDSLTQKTQIGVKNTNDTNVFFCDHIEYLFDCQWDDKIFNTNFTILLYVYHEQLQEKHICVY